MGDLICFATFSYSLFSLLFVLWSLIELKILISLLLVVFKINDYRDIGGGSRVQEPTVKCRLLSLLQDSNTPFSSRVKWVANSVWHTTLWLLIKFAQERIYLIQKQPSCKKSVRPPRRPLWKKMWNPRWWPRNGCDGSLIAKILIMTIQVNLVLDLSETWRRQHKFAWIVIIKIFAINLPSQSFLSRHLGSHIFFHNGLLGGRTLFLQLSFFWIRFLLVEFLRYSNIKFKAIAKHVVDLTLWHKSV